MRVYAQIHANNVAKMVELTSAILLIQSNMDKLDEDGKMSKKKSNLEQTK